MLEDTLSYCKGVNSDSYLQESELSVPTQQHRATWEGATNPSWSSNTSRTQCLYNVFIFPATSAYPFILNNHYLVVLG